MSSSRFSLATSFKTSCNHSAMSSSVEEANPETVVGPSVVKGQPLNRIASENLSTEDYSINFLPHPRRVSSWIEDDLGDEDAENDGKPVEKSGWLPCLTAMPDYDSDVESVELDDLPPSPPPLRYSNRSGLIVSQSLCQHESRSDLDQLSEMEMSQSDSFISPRSTWVMPRPKRLNGLGFSVSLPALPPRHGLSIIDSPVCSPIIEEENPTHFSRASMRPDLETFTFGFWISPVLIGLLSFVKAFHYALQALINWVNFMHHLLVSIKKFLDSFDALIEKVTLAIESLRLAWQKYQQNHFKIKVRKLRKI